MPPGSTRSGSLRRARCCSGFSLWNLVAYLAGVVVGLWLDVRVADFVTPNRIVPQASTFSSQETGSTRE